MNCPKCKAEIDADSFFCDQCGQEIRYCQSCHRLGKGNRCTACGGRMLPAADSSGCPLVTTPMAVASHPMEGGGGISLASSSQAMEYEATVKVSGLAASARLVFSNSMLGISFEGVDGAIIGRRQGIYQAFFSRYPYVSGSHAQLKFDAGQKKWMIVDMHSSNGTKYNGKPLTAGVPCVLENGATVQLANVLLTVNLS